VERPVESAPSASCSGNPLSRLVGQLGYSIVRSFNSIAKPAGLRPVHLRAIMELSNGPLSQHDLGEILGIEPTRLVVLLNELDAAGYIERQRDPGDRRRHIVALAQACPERLAALQSEVSAIEDRVFGVLTTSEREQLQALLARVSAQQPESADRDCP
jgi:DNA-binding MarR family transcriptional regulator